MSEDTKTDEKSTERGNRSDDKRREQPSDDKRRRTSSGETPRRSSSAESASGTRSTRSKSGTTSKKKVSAVQAVKKAVDQFSTLTGRSPESVVGARWEDDHWAVRLEVVESRRIPDTADLLAEYDVELDEGGELLAYSRKDRYVRGRPTE